VGVKIDINKRDKETLLMAMEDAIISIEVLAQSYEDVYGIKDKYMATQRKNAERILKRYKALDTKLRTRFKKEK